MQTNQKERKLHSKNLSLIFVISKRVLSVGETTTRCKIQTFASLFQFVNEIQFTEGSNGRRTSSVAHTNVKMRFYDFRLLERQAAHMFAKAIVGKSLIIALFSLPH